MLDPKGTMIGKRPWWRIYNGRSLNIQVEWDPCGLWIGICWVKTDLCLHFYICLLPFLPIHITKLR